QGEIGDQGLRDCRRMANSIPENIAIRVCTDGTWRKWIATDTGLRDIGDPKLLRLGSDLLEMGRDIEPRHLDRGRGFKLLERTLQSPVELGGESSTQLHGRRAAGDLLRRQTQIR